MSLPGPNIGAKKEELLDLDIQLRRKQVGWETPRNILLIIGAAMTALSVLVAGAGYLGFRLGRETPPSPSINIVIPPNLIAPQK